MAELLAVFVPVFALLVAAVAAMAVGVIFRRPCLRGSCGADPEGRHGGKLACIGCPRRRET